MRGTQQLGFLQAPSERQAGRVLTGMCGGQTPFLRAVAWSSGRLRRLSLCVASPGAGQGCLPLVFSDPSTGPGVRRVECVCWAEPSRPHGQGGAEGPAASHRPCWARRRASGPEHASEADGKFVEAPRKCRFRRPLPLSLLSYRFVCVRALRALAMNPPSGHVTMQTIVASATGSCRAVSL